MPRHTVLLDHGVFAIERTDKIRAPGLDMLSKYDKDDLSLLVSVAQGTTVELEFAYRFLLWSIRILCI
jgi:hypothetical protein